MAHPQARYLATDFFGNETELKPAEEPKAKAPQPKAEQRRFGLTTGELVDEPELSYEPEPPAHPQRRYQTPLTRAQEHYEATLNEAKAARDRRELREEAQAAERDYRDALEANRPGFTGKIAAPPKLERQAARIGGGYVSKGGGDYDWFYGLSRDEQARIRENWFTHAEGAMSPDEVEAAGLPLKEWLALTRGIDAAKALQARSELKASRYGGRNPKNFLRAGRPEDHGERYGDHRGDRVRFFTDPEGVVHPIRASYEHTDAARHVNSRGEEYGEEVF